MPQLRYDPLGRRHVLLAPERARRGAPSVEPFRPDPEPCDFCGGQEERTPPETFSVRHDGSEPDTAGWGVRVVPNLYPATPFHEVVVHSPHHLARFETLDRDHQRDVMLTYRSRVAACPTPSPIVVWNRGRASGASRSHPHGQVFGLEQAPPTIAREAETFADGDCVLCAWRDDEALLVSDVDGWRVVAHPVPFVAHELLIAGPCTPSITDVTDAQLGDVAEAFAAAVRRTVAFAGDAIPFNLVVHTAPHGTGAFHWHAHLMPRTATWGGLEMGAELPIVAADPLETAKALRPADG